MYAWLTAGADAEARRKLDDDLHAPEGGWQAAEEKMMSRMRAMAGGR